MDIQFGPHWYRNTDGTIEIEGLPQIEIELPKNGKPPRVNFAIFDAVGKMPGKLMNSSLAVNEMGAFTLSKDPTHLAIKKTIVAQRSFTFNSQKETRSSFHAVSSSL